MKSLIVVTFAFLAFVFYEMSGGTDFVPRKAELIEAARIAETERAQQAQERERAIAAAVPETPAAAKAETQIVQIASAGPATPEPIIMPATQPLIVQNTAQPGSPAQPPITLVSLEQSATLFAQPTQRLEDIQPTNEPAYEEQSDIREVAGSRVNLRDGPGTGFSVLTSLVQGTEVEVLASDGTGWVKLRALDEDRVGWMAESLLSDPSG